MLSGGMLSGGMLSGGLLSGGSAQWGVLPVFYIGDGRVCNCSYSSQPIALIPL